MPDAPRRYDRKVKNAQEAHEAIRPAGDRFRTPAERQGELDRDELGLYDLVWRRTLASQMVDAQGQHGVDPARRRRPDGRDAEFGVSGTVITVRGFLVAYEEGRDDEADDGDAARRLPDLKQGDRVQPRSSSRRVTRRPRRRDTRRRRS